MQPIHPKKRLGQHFLSDHNIARKIVNIIDFSVGGEIVEIGPGKGILTKYLMEKASGRLTLIEFDQACIAFLKNHYPQLKEKLMENDVLKVDFENAFNQSITLIGNLPYNISSQVFFLVFRHRRMITQAVFMIQKEVGERISATPGNKNYGILSVLLQAFYDIHYAFTVNEQVFVPPPKVKSAVVHLIRNDKQSLPCDEALFLSVVKKAFNHRRKTLRNSLKDIINRSNIPADKPVFDKRPEQLSVENFIALTEMLQN